MKRENIHTPRKTLVANIRTKLLSTLLSSTHSILKRDRADTINHTAETDISTTTSPIIHLLEIRSPSREEISELLLQGLTVRTQLSSEIQVLDSRTLQLLEGTLVRVQIFPLLDNHTIAALQALALESNPLCAQGMKISYSRLSENFFSWSENSKEQRST